MNKILLASHGPLANWNEKDSGIFNGANEM